MGLNWALCAGGAITREVYGSPDDDRGFLDGENSIAKGFWNALKERKYYAEQLVNFNPEIIQCNNLYCDLPLTNDGYYYDCEPDLFLYSFINNSGSFMIDNQGNVKTSNKGFKVDMSGFTEQTVINKYPLNSEIKITTPDGYIYSFGSLNSSIDALEYNFRFKPGQTYPLANRRPTIMAWHLTKITAPNGRTLKITYASSYPENYASPLWQSTQSVIPNSKVQDYSYLATNTVLPESIEIEDTGIKIEFIRSVETCRRFYSNYEEYNYPSYQLDEIRVKHDQEVLYTYHFSYENIQHLRFLSQIRQADQGLYTFSYNHTIYPDPNTTDIDYWGYWKQTKSSSSGGGGPVISELFSWDLIPDTIENAVKQTPLAYSLLQKVTYPTGGVSEFTYEPHQYGSRVDTQLKTTLLDFTPRLVHVNGQTNGFRIKMIKSAPDTSSINGSSEIKTYSYLKDVSESESSGILYQYPPYYLNSVDTAFVLNNVWSKNYNIEENPIGYSTVKESLGDGLYTCFTYSDYTNCPDTPNVNFKSNGSGVNLLTLVFDNVNRISSSAYRRGLLRKKSSFDSTGKELKGQTNSYKYIAKQEIKVDTIAEPTYDDCIVLFKPITNGAMTKQIYIRNCLPLKETEWNFVGGNQILDQKEYEYNGFDLLAVETQTLSNGSILKNTYTYPTDLFKPLQTSNIYTQMVTRNLLNKLVETKHYKDSSFLFSSKTKYGIAWSGNVQIDTLFTRKSGYSYEPLKVYSAYDGIGNPVYEIKNNNEKTVWLWGYRAKYIIASICNASYDEVKSALGSITPEELSLSNSPDMSVIDNLRQKLPKAQVATYTYKPLTGMTSMCNPRGEVTTYEYDTYGKLIKTIDHTGKVIERYDYHYKP